MKLGIFRVFFAGVWLVNGMYCKVLDGVPRHRWIVARILGEDHSLFLTRLIGIAEIAMAVWKGKLFETSAHIAFVLLWAYLTTVFLLTGLS
ncbi:MAG: hypothetical protein JNN07_24030 [Verrucomicrobiales bacterium]|nr:hypothetical protein [Verrucomicrobiales bacterium]